MISEMISFKIPEGIEGLLAQIDAEILQQYAKLQGLDEKTRSGIHRFARIRMMGASTRIENAVLTDTEIDWLDDILGKDGKKSAFAAHRRKIEDKLSKDRRRSIEEVAGARAMLQVIYSQSGELFPLSNATIQGLHRELLQFYPDASHYLGKFKTQPNRVVEKNHDTGEERVVFQTADPGVVTQTAMADLVHWYNATLPKERHALAVACEFVFRFLAIHPFQDGNGRLGRGLFLLALLQSPHRALAGVVPYLAIDRQVELRREEYYLVLNQCSQGKFAADSKDYEIHFFLHFMAKALQRALGDIDFYEKRFSAIADLSKSAALVYACFRDQPELELQAMNICQTTQLPRRTVSHILTQLLRDQLISRMGKGAGVRYRLE